MRAKSSEYIDQFLITEAIKKGADRLDADSLAHSIKIHCGYINNISKDPAVKHACRILNRQRNRIANNIVALRAPNKPLAWGLSYINLLKEDADAWTKKIEINAFQTAATRYRVAAAMLLLLSLALVAAAITTASIYGGYLNLDFVVQSSALIQSMSTNLLIAAGSIACATTCVSTLGVAALFYNGNRASHLAQIREHALTHDEKGILSRTRPGLINHDVYCY